MAEAPGISFDEGTPQGVPTPAGASVAAMLGASKRGRVDRTVVVRTWADYVKNFGGFGSGVDLSIHVWNHFKNGGGPLRLLRVAPADAVAATNTAGVLQRGSGSVAFNVKASNPGAWGNKVSTDFVRAQLIARAGEDLQDAEGNDLPGSNVDSLDVVRVPVESLVGINVGDVLDVFSSGNAWNDDGPFYVLGTDPGGRAVYLNKTGTAVAASDYLRTSSQHRARTIAAEDLGEDAVSSLLDSVEGIGPGSVLTYHLFSHCASAAAESLAQVTHVVVDRVVGRRVYFTGNSVNGSTLPAKTAAKLQVLVDAPDGFLVTAAGKGPAGNAYSFQVRAGQGSAAVAVLGKLIRVDTTAGQTVANLIAAVAADATASALVTVTAVGDDVALQNLAATPLTGGANLCVTSQEFYMAVYEDGQLAQKHEYLSLVPTSADYVGDRLGGDAAAYLPDEKNESRLIIVDGDDGTVNAGLDEVGQMPRALTGVGLSGGDDGSALSDADVIGADSPRSGIYLLPEAEDIAVACAPGFTSVEVAQAGYALAKANGTFQWLADVPEDLVTRDDIMVYRQQSLGTNNDFGGLFGPWGFVLDPRPGVKKGALVKVPPTPVVTGVLNSAVKSVGAHGSVGNQLSTFARLTYNASPAEHADLNEAGVCLFKAVSQRGIYLMGDRTLLEGPADARKFGNARRWLCYFRRTIGPALQGSLFAPANGALFGHVLTTVDQFLESEWKKGALYPSEAKRLAYSVKCDGETTTLDDLAEGRVVCEVSVSPVVPAEKIKFRLDVSLGGIGVTEA